MPKTSTTTRDKRTTKHPNQYTNGNSKSTTQHTKEYHQQKTDNLKAEIASELGVKLGGDASARENGTVGGEMTKRLVSEALGSDTKKSNR